MGGWAISYGRGTPAGHTQKRCLRISKPKYGCYSARFPLYPQKAGGGAYGHCMIFWVRQSFLKAVVHMPNFFATSVSGLRHHSSSISSLLRSHAILNLKWCDRIKLSNILLPRKRGTIKSLQLLSTSVACGVGRDSPRSMTPDGDA